MTWLFAASRLETQYKGYEAALLAVRSSYAVPIAATISLAATPRMEALLPFFYLKLAEKHSFSANRQAKPNADMSVHVPFIARA